MTSKTQNFFKVAQAILEILLVSNTKGITISAVARRSDVSRAWIYKYIGAKNEDLLQFAIDFFGRFYSNLDDRPVPKNAKEWFSQVSEGFERMLKHTEHYPFIVPVYFKYISQQNLIGERIRHVEGQFEKVSTLEIQQSLKLSRTEAVELAQVLISMRMAFAHRWFMTENKTPESRKKLVQSLRRILKGSLKV